MTSSTDRTNPKPPPVDRVSALWRRVNERKIVQWSVAYVALAYGIQHGLVLTSDAFEWPHAVQQVSMLLLAFGLPVVMVFAWYHGEQASRRISGPELTIIAILLAIGSLFFFVLVKPGEQVAAAHAPAVQETSPTAARVAAASPNGAVSVVVLPFSNMSGDASQEFFSDGMTEEITAALAKVPDLRVVARTSAFEFKGKNIEVDKIGQQLHATHLIEGSVRKDGNQVRITAQLIKANDGTHLWTESYDRELKGVFAVQEEIATAIAASLRVPLGLKEGQSLVPNRIVDTDSYQQYLRAKALVRIRAPLEPGGPLTQATQLLEQVVASVPDYAPASALLSQAYGIMPFYTAAFSNGAVGELRRIVEQLVQKADAAAQKAVRLDPGDADGYVALGAVRQFQGRFAEAEDLYRRALSLDRGNPDALHRMSLALATVGRVRESVPLRLQLRAQEPLVPTFNVATGGVLWASGQTGQAIATLQPLPVSAFSGVFLAQAYASADRFGEAAETLRRIPEGVFPPAVISEAVRVLTDAPKTSPPVKSLSSGLLGFVYAYAGAPDRILDFYEGLAEARYPEAGDIPYLLWAPAYSQTRKTERFRAYARKAGLVDYWRARGWPDLCHPTTGDDFVCS